MDLSRLVLKMAATGSNTPVDIGVIGEKARGPAHDEEVSHTITTDNIQVLGLRPDGAEFYMNYSPEARKRLLWKVQ